MATLTCNLCDARSSEDSVETAEAKCDVRAFASERFRVWRCPGCRSIHSRDAVDLAHYYAGYPFHSPALDWRIRAICRNMCNRLTDAGVGTDAQLLDYGCGGGTLIAYLKECGFTHAVGFDEFQEGFKDRAVLDRQHTVLVSQDVIEHVLEPRELIDTFDRLVAPGGIIAIGTPNAENIDLARPEYFVHALHQPFHTHLLSRQWLLDAGAQRGWKLLRYYDREFINTLVPFVNLRFAQHYAACFDDTMDAAFEVRVDSWKLWSPLTLYYGLFGYFLSERTGGMAIFRKPDNG